MHKSNLRRFFTIAAIAWAALTAANAQGTDTPNVALVKGLYAAFGKGDVATITPDVAWEAVGRASDFPAFGPRKGPAAVQEFFNIVGKELTFTAFAPQEFFAVGDRVFVLGRSALTVKRTGKSAELDWVHIFTIADGKVKAFREFNDTAKIAEANRG